MEVRYLLSQRSKNEFTLWYTDMRNIKTRVRYRLISIHQNIEVDVARPLINDLVTAHFNLNCLELIQQCQGLKFSFNLFHVSKSHLEVISIHSTYLTSAVQKSILVRHVHRLRLPQATRPLDADAALVHFATCLLNLNYTISHIATKGDICRFRSRAASAAAS